MFLFWGGHNLLLIISNSWLLFVFNFIALIWQDRVYFLIDLNWTCGPAKPADLHTRVRNNADCYSTEILCCFAAKIGTWRDDNDEYNNSNNGGGTMAGVFTQVQLQLCGCLHCTAHPGRVWGLPHAPPPTCCSLLGYYLRDRTLSSMSIV